MSKLPRAKEVQRILKKLGFEKARQNGSHAIYKNAEGIRIPVPVHGGKTISPGVFFAILKDLNIKEKDFWTVK